MDSREKFAQMLREGYETLDPEKEQREYIRELLRQKEQQRKRRIKTITAVAAAFLIVVGAVLAVGGCFGSVEADKNDRTKVEEQDGSVVISDENADGQEVGSESVIETDWNKVDKLKEKYPEMITFTDVPEGMKFVSVEVKDYNNIFIDIIFCFRVGDCKIRVFQEYCSKEEQRTQIVREENNEIIYKEYKINMNEEDCTATVFNETNAIDIIGVSNQEKVFNILDKIESF